MYHVELESRAKRELFDLPQKAIQLLTDAIEDLKFNPRSPDSKKLTGKDGYRIRKSHYRVLYTIDDKNKLVRIYRIGHRREVYRG